MKNKEPFFSRIKTSNKILFCGDICLNDDDYNISKSTIDLFKQADFRIANLEAPILVKEKTKHPLPKAGSNLFQTPESIDKLCKILNINYFGGANNHISDYGLDGVESTQKFLIKKNIIFFGAGRNKDESKKYVNLTDKIVVLAVAEDEFGVSSDTQFGYYSIYNTEITETVKMLCKLGKIVIIYGHGGGEEIPLPSSYLRNRYRELIDFGAKVVVSHHPHIPQGYEKYKNGLIYYSLGNFIHSSYKKSYGNILVLEIGRNNILSGNLYAVHTNYQDLNVSKLNLLEKKYLKNINNVLEDSNKYNSILNILSVDMFNSYYKGYFSQMNFKVNNSNLLLLSVLIRNRSHREFILNAISVLTNKIGNKNNIIDNLKYRQFKSFIKSKLS